MLELEKNQLEKLYNSVTIIIKTFESPECLNRLIKSIKRHYLGIKTLVADDSKKPIERNDVAGYYAMQFDSGLSAGRNFLLNKVKTKYFLLLDDDFVLTEETNLEKMMEVLETSGIDLVGGEALDYYCLPGLKKEGNKYKREFFGLLELKERKLFVKMRENKGSLDGYKLYDFVAAPFMARTDKIKKIQWDGDLKIMEHEDFFLRCKDKINITHLDEVKVDHIRERNSNYWKFRGRVKKFVEKFKQKHGIKEIYVKFGNKTILAENYGEDCFGQISTKIPKNFFYYWTGQDFLYPHYLSVLSLLKTNNVNKIGIYFEEEPVNNKNLEMLKKLDSVNLIKINFDELFEKCKLQKEDFKEFFAKAKPNHKSDLVRYLLLYAEGGVYLDFDTLVIKDLSNLLNVPFFAAPENPKGIKLEIPKELKLEKINSIINGAVLGACKKTETIKNFFEEIKKISKTKAKFHWIEVGPALLSRMHEKEKFFIYPREYFYKYYWGMGEWAKVFEEGNLNDENVFVIHLWGSNSRKTLKEINEEYIKSSNSLYAKTVRNILGTRL